MFLNRMIFYSEKELYNYSALSCVVSFLSTDRNAILNPVYSWTSAFGSGWCQRIEGWQRRQEHAGQQGSRQGEEPPRRQGIEKAEDTNARRNHIRYGS